MGGEGDFAFPQGGRMAFQQTPFSTLPQLPAEPAAVMDFRQKMAEGQSPLGQMPQAPLA